MAYLRRTAPPRVSVRAPTVGVQACMRWGARCTLYCQVVTAASEAAEMILRVDDIIKCAPRQRGQEY